MRIRYRLLAYDLEFIQLLDLGDDGREAAGIACCLRASQCRHDDQDQKCKTLRASAYLHGFSRNVP